MDDYYKEAEERRRLKIEEERRHRKTIRNRILIGIAAFLIVFTMFMSFTIISPTQRGV